MSRGRVVYAAARHDTLFRQRVILAHSSRKAVFLAPVPSAAMTPVSQPLTPMLPNPTNPCRRHARHAAHAPCAHAIHAARAVHAHTPPCPSCPRPHLPPTPTCTHHVYARVLPCRHTTKAQADHAGPRADGGVSLPCLARLPAPNAPTSTSIVSNSPAPASAPPRHGPGRCP